MPDAIQTLISDLEASKISTLQQPVVVPIADFINALNEIEGAIGGGSVSSVTNTDTNLTITPSSGAVVANINVPNLVTTLTPDFDVAGSAATAQTNAEAFATTAANTAQSNAETYAANSSNQSSGTLSQARIVSIGTIASSATPTPNSANTQFNVTALAVGATIAAPTGTPIDGQKLIIRIKDNGSVQTLAWNSTYRVITNVTLPTATLGTSLPLYIGCIWNAQDSFWDVVAAS